MRLAALYSNRNITYYI